MSQSTPTNRISIPLFGFGKSGCEGPQCVSIDLDFSVDNTALVDLSALQALAAFSGCETVYINNVANTKNIDWECDGTYQTGRFPASSCGYLNLLMSNPPKVKFTSTGAGLLVRASFLNYFLPPIIWKP
jgi:hypothetical protein